MRDSTERKKKPEEADRESKRESEGSGREGKKKKNRQHFNCFLKKVEMKNRVSLEGYGEILAGRIARPYEKGTPRAKQGDEYWFFIKHFASISRERTSRGEGWRRRKENRVKEGKDGRRGAREAQASLLCVFTQSSQRRRRTRRQFDTSASAC